MSPIWLIAIGVGIPLALAVCGFALVPAAAYLAKDFETTAAVSSKQLDSAYPLTRFWWFGLLSSVCFLAFCLELPTVKLGFALTGYLAYGALPILCLSQFYRFVRSLQIARSYEHEPPELVRYARRTAVMAGVFAVFSLWLLLAVLFLQVPKPA